MRVMQNASVVSLNRLTLLRKELWPTTTLFDLSFFYALGIPRVAFWQSAYLIGWAKGVSKRLALGLNQLEK